MSGGCPAYCFYSLIILPSIVVRSMNSGVFSKDSRCTVRSRVWKHEAAMSKNWAQAMKVHSLSLRMFSRLDIMREQFAQMRGLIVRLKDIIVL
jgi:hypothetical protein